MCVCVCVCVGLYAVLNDNLNLNGHACCTNRKPAPLILLASCEVIKIYSRLSDLLLINVILGVRERVRSLAPSCAASSGRQRKKLNISGVKQTKQSVTT